MIHELAHVIQRHGLSGYKDRKAKIIAAHITDLMLMGTSIAYIPYIASISSYSRAHEKEADEMALRIMSAAGYPLSGATELFRVISEVKVEESVNQSIYSSHPDNGYRMQYTQDLIEKERLPVNPGVSANADVYQAMTRPLHAGSITLRLLNKHYELAKDCAERALQREPGNPAYLYYRGEALRLMAEDPNGAAREHARLYDKTFNDDLVAEFTGRAADYRSQAGQVYREVLAIDPAFAPAYRGIGLIAHARGDFAESRVALAYYLANAEDVPDRRYIESVLTGMDNKE